MLCNVTECALIVCVITKVNVAHPGGDRVIIGHYSNVLVLCVCAN